MQLMGFNKQLRRTVTGIQPYIHTWIAISHQNTVTNYNVVNVILFSFFSEPERGADLSKGEIVGIALGLLVCLVIGGFICKYCKCCKRQNGRTA
jgi:hypothetical protein